METAPEIDFIDMEPRPELGAKIVAKLAQLEKVYGRMTACRVVAKGPSGHHRTGGQHPVTIYIALPDGRERSVARTPAAAQRFADAVFAPTPAFRRARPHFSDPSLQLPRTLPHHRTPPLHLPVTRAPPHA